MKQGNYGKGSIYRRQDGRWAAAVAKREQPLVTLGLTVKSI